MTAMLVTTIRAEIAALEAELKADPRVVKLEMLRNLLALYERTEESGQVPVSRPDSKVADSFGRHLRTSLAGPSKMSEARAEAERLSAEYIRGRVNPTPTREIASMLAQKGVEIGGTNPISNLSAILSKSPYFQADGRKGWLLVDEEPASEQPHDTPNEDELLIDVTSNNDLDDDGVFR